MYLGSASATASSQRGKLWVGSPVPQRKGFPTATPDPADALFICAKAEGLLKNLSPPAARAARFLFAIQSLWMWKRSRSHFAELIH